MKRLLFFLLLCGGVYFGYRHFVASDSVVSSAPESISEPTREAPGKLTGLSAPPVAGETPVASTPMTPCTRCQATGFTKCTGYKCLDGWVDCPGHCLKLSVGRWQHLEVAGHDPKELWQKFTYNGGYAAWTTAHVGEVIETRDGKPTNIGKCPVCGGKGKVPCKVCQGTGHIVCVVCGGKKYLPVCLVKTRVPAPAMPIPPATVAASAPSEHPDEAIQLKDGTTIHGKIVVVDTDAVWIHKMDGETIQVLRKKLLKPPTR